MIDTSTAQIPEEAANKGRERSITVTMEGSYSHPVSHKYMPMGMESSAHMKASIAKDILFRSLRNGLEVYKYGKYSYIFI